jgi:hypothetical protein
MPCSLILTKPSEGWKGLKSFFTSVDVDARVEDEDEGEEEEEEVVGLGLDLDCTGMPAVP